MFSHKISSMLVMDVLTKTIAGIVKTNLLLSTPKMTLFERNPKNFTKIIKEGCYMFQRVCKAAALASGSALLVGAIARAAEICLDMPAGTLSCLLSCQNMPGPLTAMGLPALLTSRAI